MAELDSGTSAFSVRPLDNNISGRLALVTGARLGSDLLSSTHLWKYYVHFDPQICTFLMIKWWNRICLRKSIGSRRMRCGLTLQFELSQYIIGQFTTHVFLKKRKSHKSNICQSLNIGCHSRIRKNHLV
jgi:hypothetical protein